MDSVHFASRARLAVLGAFVALVAACGDSNNDNAAARGDLIANSDLTVLPKSAIDAATAASGLQALSGKALCDVAIKSLTYVTATPLGGVTDASGAVLVPGGAGCPGPYPIVAYARGTEVVRSRTMANPADDETALLMGMLAAQGYIVVATDYLGYAKSSFSYHPYLHAETQATSVIDSVVAAKKALANSGVATTAKLFVTGYSQGGHAAMATHRAIERDAPAGLSVTAAGPMSGPYDLSGTFVSGVGLLPVGAAGSTVFTPMLVTGYQKVYGNVYSTATEYFKAPYATGIESLLPGSLSFEQLFTQGKLPLLLGDLLTPKAVSDVTTTSSSLRRALDANTLLGWTPRAPVLLCAGARDPVVAFQNTVTSAADITARGGRVSVVDVEQVPAFAPALPPAGATAAQLATYHGTVVPPLCLKAVRDSLFAPLK